MRFIHMADMHFDTPFTVLNSKAGLGEERRLEQRQIFKKVIEYIKKENIEFLFISGDLYEHNYVKKTTIEYINKLFKEIPNTKIFISPGNHDPYLKNSYYNTFTWSSNVHIFNSQIKKYEFEDVCIYGYGFEDFYCNYSGCEEIRIENPNKINILVTHGSIDASKKMELQYNPIKGNNLLKIGFDYVALGHIHKREIFEKNIVYPGSIISFGFDELGEHGILDVKLIKNNNEKNKIKINKNNSEENNQKIEKNNENNLKINFIKLDERIFQEKRINISEINTEEELIENINQLSLEDKNMYKIILEGQRQFEININKICKLINRENIIKLKDETIIKYDLDKLAKEKNLRGLFVKEMLEKLNDEKKEFKMALEIGLEALKNK